MTLDGVRDATAKIELSLKIGAGSLIDHAPNIRSAVSEGPCPVPQSQENSERARKIGDKLPT